VYDASAVTKGYPTNHKHTSIAAAAMISTEDCVERATVDVDHEDTGISYRFLKTAEYTVGSFSSVFFGG
jgi:hypothetical protein